jgi:threonine dehydrogenase-like Zn-dependent dehydrogenase
MRALVFKEKLLYQTDYPTPQPRNDEALIKVTHAGICNTDLEIIKGYMSFQGVLGHEFVGVVISCREKGLEGKRVVGEINIGCGSCFYCQSQMQNHCPNRSVLGILNKDGVFAEYITLPVRNLHVVPDSVSDEEAVFVEPLAAAFEILRQVDIKPSDRVCILGDGKLGLLVGQVISTTKCNLIVVGNHEEKLSILKRRGINTQLSSSFKQREFDIVIDCTGSPYGVESALKIIKPRGKVIIKTTTAKKESIDLNQVVVNELTLIGSRCGPFPTAMRAIETKAVELYPLISGHFPLENGIEAIKHAAKKEVLKIILKMT